MYGSQCVATLENVPMRMCPDCRPCSIRADTGNQLIEAQRFSIFAIGVSEKETRKKETRARVSLFLEAPPGFEPGVKDLQSHALPLGYGAKKMERATRFELATSTLARWRSAK